MNILVAELIWPEGLDELEASGRVAYDSDLRREPRRLRREVESADALIVRNQTRVDAALLESGASLKAIGRLGALSDILPLQGVGMRDLFEMRKVLEAEGAGWAAGRRNDYHLERLKGILEDAHRNSENLEVLSERDTQFHVAIAEASQNLVLVRVMLTLLDLLAASRRDTLSIPGRARRSLEDHERILRGIHDQDPDEARHAMLDHLNSVERSLADLREKARR